MNTKLVVGLVVLCGVAVPVAVHAGFRRDNETCGVSFDGQARKLIGGFANSYNSTNKFESIILNIVDTATSTTVQITVFDCNNAYQGYVWRNDGNARILAAARSVRDDDRLIVKWDTAGQITSFEVDRYSGDRPKGL